MPSLRLVVFGESLGGGPAIDLASRQPSAGLIVQSAFTSIGDMASHTMPFFPTGWLIRSKFDNLAKMPQVGVPSFSLPPGRTRLCHTGRRGGSSTRRVSRRRGWSSTAAATTTSSGRSTTSGQQPCGSSLMTWRRSASAAHRHCPRQCGGCCAWLTAPPVCGRKAVHSTQARSTPAQRSEDCRCVALVSSPRTRHLVVSRAGMRSWSAVPGGPPLIYSRTS